MHPFALYVHIPWCRHVCPYCDFTVYATSSPPETAYVAGLRRELRARATEGPFARRAAKSVFLGGGTPSLFSPGALASLLAETTRCFGIGAGAEVTLEANPGTLSRASLAGYRAAGVNRLSLGAQSFHAAHLRTLGRDHAPEDISAAVDAARAAGFENVSLDLIFAVPGASLADWEQDLAAAIALAPTHVSAYSLTYEEGTPFHRWRSAGRIVAVPEDDEAAMAEATAHRLADAGYERYEISSWARPGWAAQHNLSYWDGSDYLGIGTGAHSFTSLPAPGRRWINERIPERYLATIRTRGTAVASEEPLSEAEARAEFSFCGLRQTAGVDLDAFRRRFGVRLDDAFPHVQTLLADGLVEEAGARLRLTSTGLRFADTVAATFV